MNKQIVALAVLMISQVAFGRGFWPKWCTETDKTQADVCYDYIKHTDGLKAERSIVGGNYIAGFSAATGILSVIGLCINQLALENPNFNIFNASFEAVNKVSLLGFGLSFLGFCLCVELVRDGERIKGNLKSLKHKLAKQTPEKVQEARKEDEQREQEIKREQENAALQNELLKLKVAKQKQSA